MSEPGVDPDSPEVIADPYPLYRALRDRRSLGRHPRTGEWLVARFADLQAVTTDPVTFSSEVRPESHDHMASLDAPRHDLHRGAIARLFHARRIAELRQEVEQRCRMLLLPLVEDGRIDVGTDLSAVLPSQMVTGLVGLPVELAEPFREIALSVTTLGGTPAVYDAIAELQAIVRQAVVSYALPPDGILANLMAAVAGGSSGLQLPDVIGICSNLVLAGTDTAGNLIANATVLLWRHPELRRRLVDDPSLVPVAVEEILRFESPVQWMGRRVTRAASLGGVELERGAVLRLYWGAANRDERIFERPDELWIDRPAQRHLGFGYGLHFCVGAALARLEATVAVRTLLELAPGYEVEEGGLVRYRSAMFRGYEHVPVRAG